MTKVISLRNMKIRKNEKQKKVSVSKDREYNISEDKYKIIITIIAIISIFAGCLIYKNCPIEEINDKCGIFISELQTNKFLNIFITFISFDLTFFICTSVFGTSFIGVSLIEIPVILRCLYMGYLCSYLYNEYSLKGVLFCLIFLFPFFVITTTNLIYVANEGIYMSVNLFRKITNKNTADDMTVRLYLIRFLFLLGINIACITVNSFIITFLGTRISLLN